LYFTPSVTLQYTLLLFVLSANNYNYTNYYRDYPNRHSPPGSLIQPLLATQLEQQQQLHFTREEKGKRE